VFHVFLLSILSFLSTACARLTAGLETGSTTIRRGAHAQVAPVRAVLLRGTTLPSIIGRIIRRKRIPPGNGFDRTAAIPLFAGPATIDG